MGTAHINLKLFSFEIFPHQVSNTCSRGEPLVSFCIKRYNQSNHLNFSETETEGMVDRRKTSEG